MPRRKRDSLTETERKSLRREVQEALATLDLQVWQEVCRSFGPYNYARTTRKKWFEENKDKLETAREIVSFVGELMENLQKGEGLDGIKTSVIRSEIVDVVRQEEEARGLSDGKLNLVKLSAFKTLISFSEEPHKLEEGPYEGMTEISEKRRREYEESRNRESRKGQYRAPEVNPVKREERKSKNYTMIIIGLVNDFTHPYQNVEIELDLDAGLSVEDVEGCIWKPDESRIEVGFLQASLSAEPYEKEIVVRLRGAKSETKRKIRAIVHYDNCEKGIRDSGDKEVGRLTV